MDKDDILIRPFRPADAEAIIGITGEVFEPVSIDAKIEHMLGRPGAGWVEIKAQVIRQEITEDPAGCFVAERGGEIVGYVTTTVNRLASRGVIANLAVRSVCQGKGLGRKLIERGLAYFRELGLAQAKIETLACNEAGQHLYPSVGFREVVRQIHYVMPLK